MARKSKPQVVVLEENDVADVGEIVHGVPLKDLVTVNDILDAIMEDEYTGIGTLKPTGGTRVHRNFNKD